MGENLDTVFEKIKSGYYNEFDSNLRKIFQLLIDIDDAAVTSFTVEEYLVKAISALTNNSLKTFNEIVQEIKTMDKEFLEELQGYLPEKTDNPYFQYLIDVIKEKEIEAKDLDLTQSIDYASLFIFFYNERRFSPKDGPRDVFIEAILNDDLHMFQAFVDNNEVNLEGRNYYNDSLLHFAASHNALKIIEYLLTLGFDINLRNDFNYTPAFVALFNNQHDALKLLIDRGADLTIVNKDGYTVTELTIVRDDVEALKYILDNRKQSKTGIRFDAYLESLRYQALKVYNYLKSINYKGKLDRKELFLVAARYGILDVMESYLNEGLSVNLCYKKRTPILFTIVGGSVEATQYLLDKGADPNPDGFSPLLQAIREGKNDIAKLLISYGANPHSQGKKVLTPLLMAIYAGNMEMVEYLLALGVDINQTGYKGLTPFLVAIDTNQVEIIKYLFAHGAETLPSDRLILSRALQQGRTEIIELLFEKGFCLEKKLLSVPIMDQLLVKARKGKLPDFETMFTSQMKDRNNVKLVDYFAKLHRKVQKLVLFSTIVFLFLAIFLAFLVGITFKEYIYYNNNIARTTAVITDLDLKSSRVFYQYEVNGTLYEADTFLEHEAIRKLHVSENINIIYKLNAAEKSITASHFKSLFSDLISLSVGLVLCLCIDFWTFKSYLTNKKYIKKISS